MDILIDKYYKSVGRNTTLILGVTPAPDGLMPEPDVKRLSEFGEEILRRFSNPIASTTGSGKKIILKLDKKQHVNQILLMENIESGERVREFTIEGKAAGGWRTLCSGSCVGHKFIAQFDDVEVSSVRLVINKSFGEPMIKEFSAYAITEDVEN